MPSIHNNHPEPEERVPTTRLVTHGKHWTSWPGELQEQVTRIATQQERLATLAVDGKNWSDKDLTDGLIIATVWPSLRTGLYPWPSQTKTRTKWREQLEQLEQRTRTNLLRHESAEAKKLRAMSAERFISFSEHAAIGAAIDAARGKVATRSEERLVVFKARTRGGKTWLADQLVDEGKVNWRVEATPSWRLSFKAMLLSLCDMFGLAHAPKANAMHLEMLIIGHIKTLSGVVLFEEMQSLHRDSQEFIKIILNKSSLVVCVFVTNEAHEEMLMHGGNHLAQLLARAETTITASVITADHVRQFDPETWAKAESDKQLDRVADAANRLGALSAVRRITANVRALSKRADMITDAMITDAISAYRRAVPVVDTTSRMRRGGVAMERRAA